MHTQQLYLTFLFAGIASLLGGLLVTRTSWRPELIPFGRHSRILDILLHPGRYAQSKSLPLIRMLNWIGMVLVAIAVGFVVYDIIRLQSK
jgi:hypothetical protein